MKKQIVFLIIGMFLLVSVSALTISSLSKESFNKEVSVIDSEGVCKKLESIGKIVYSISKQSKETCETMKDPIVKYDFITQNDKGEYMIE